MMRESISKFRTAGIATCITCLLYISGALVIFTPFPLFFVAAIYGKWERYLTALFSVIVAVLLYLVVLPLLYASVSKWPLAGAVLLLPGVGIAKYFSLMSAQYFGLVYIVYFLLFGYLFGEGIMRRWSVNCWLAVAIGLPFIFLTTAVLVPEFMGMNVFEGAKSYMQSILGEVIKVQEAAGIGSFRINALKENSAEIISFSMRIVPSVVALFGLMVASANHLLARWIIRVPGRFDHARDVGRFNIPHYFVWITISAGFLYFADRYAIHSSWAGYVAINGLIIAAGIYFLQGILICHFYLRKIGSRWLRALAYISIFMFIQFAIPLITIFGFTDLWVDYRRLVREESNKRRS